MSALIGEIPLTRTLGVRVDDLTYARLLAISEHSVGRTLRAAVLEYLAQRETPTATSVANTCQSLVQSQDNQSAVPAKGKTASPAYHG